MPLQCSFTHQRSAPPPPDKQVHVDTVFEETVCDNAVVLISYSRLIPATAMTRGGGSVSSVCPLSHLFGVGMGMHPSIWGLGVKFS